MCQLTLANLGSARSNGLYLQVQGWQNTFTSNRDGFGLFNGLEIHKSSLDFSSVVNTGYWLKDRIQGRDDPIIFHVRLATAINGKKTVDDANSHPFESDHFILAHNGVLELKEDNPEYKDYTVDSLVFLTELEKAYAVEADVPKAIASAIDKFFGTFAFLIYCKDNREYYVVRGLTKLLHICYLGYVIAYDEENKPVTETYGFVVNTDAGDMEKAVWRYRAFEELLGSLHIRFSKPVLLDAESIYRVGKTDLEKVGVAKESNRPKVPAVIEIPPRGGRNNTTVTRPYNNGFLIKPVSQLEDVRKTLARINLTVSELDGICMMVFKCGVLGLTEDEWEVLAKVTLPKLESQFTSKKSTAWETIKSCTPFQIGIETIDNSMHPYQIYQQLHFPWMLTSGKKLERLAEHLKTEETRLFIPAGLVDEEGDADEEDIII